MVPLEAATITNPYFTRWARRVVDGALAVLGGHLAPELGLVVAPGRQDGVDLGQVRRVVALVEGH